MKLNFPSQVRFLILTIVIIPALGCSSVQIIPSRLSRITVFPEWEKQKKSYTLVPGVLWVETDLYKKEIQQTGTDNLSHILNRFNTDNPLKTDKKAFVALYLREFSYLKDYQPWKTLSLKLVVQDESGKIWGTYYFCTESKDSFFSSTYLYRQIEKGMIKLL